MPIDSVLGYCVMAAGVEVVLGVTGFSCAPPCSFLAAVADFEQKTGECVFEEMGSGNRAVRAITSAVESTVWA